jgi:ABC-2 type transport system permease protein
MSSVVFEIARNEFSRCLGHPLVIFMTIFLVIFTLIVIGGQYVYVSQNPKIIGQIGPTGLIDDNTIFLNNNTYSSYWVSSILAFLSLCIGIVSIAGERSSGSLRVLLTKPVYRRDIIIGKFVGINLLMLLVIVFISSICVAASLVAFGMPSAFPEDILRILSFVFFLFMYCTLFTSVVLLSSVLFKNLYMSLVLCISYFLVCSMSWPGSAIWINVLNLINPKILYLAIIGECNNMQMAYLSWVSSILPYAVLMLLEILAIFLVDCYIFTREDM